MMLKFPFVPYRPFRVLYIFATVVIFLLVVTSVWFILSEFVTQIMSVGNAVAASVGSDSTTQTQVNTFFTNVKNWLPVIGLIGLTLWSLVYAQRKKQMEGYIP